MKFEGKEIDIETAFKKLDDMAKRLESGEEGLGESLKIYEKAMGLCLDCEKTLKEAKLKINYRYSENLEE